MDLSDLLKMLLAMFAYFAVLAVGFGGVWLMSRKSRKDDTNG